MEKIVKIKISTNKYLYGKFQGPLTHPLFIIVHGLPENMDGEFYHKATEFFQKKGFATFRFNLYGWQKDARQLMDCTLKIHAEDLDTTIRHFRKRGAKKIFVAGHSFGGPTILFSKEQNFDGAVLWDPSYDISFTKKSFGFPGGKYIKEANGYLMNWGVNVIIGKAMAKEVDSIKWSQLTHNFKVPFKIIVAGKGELVKDAKNYFQKTHTEKNLIIIPEATHYFDDKKGMQDKVYRASESWFRRFI